MNIAAVDYDGLIPNNVALGHDPRVKRALEKWHPGYINWWKDMGPEGFQDSLVYLRTAVSVDPKGWAKFDYVRMPEYRWGVLLAAARFPSVPTKARMPGKKCRANTAPCCAVWW
jgi:benzoyl-CoA 2,3-dioxygenase component B